VIFPPAILELASKQHQLIAFRQVVPDLVTRSWWERRRQSGALLPVFRGVNRLVGSETSTMQTIHAALLSVNRGSLASHRTITWRQVMFDEDWVVARMWSALGLRGAPPG
jgi:hypothetical protein